MVPGSLRDLLVVCLWAGACLVLLALLAESGSAAERNAALQHDFARRADWMVAPPR